MTTPFSPYPNSINEALREVAVNRMNESKRLHHESEIMIKGLARLLRLENEETILAMTENLSRGQRYHAVFPWDERDYHVDNPAPIAFSSMVATLKSSSLPSVQALSFAEKEELAKSLINDALIALSQERRYQLVPLAQWQELVLLIAKCIDNLGDPPVSEKWCEGVAEEFRDWMKKASSTTGSSNWPLKPIEYAAEQEITLPFDDNEFVELDPYGNVVSNLKNSSAATNHSSDAPLGSDQAGVDLATTSLPTSVPLSLNEVDAGIYRAVDYLIDEVMDAGNRGRKGVELLTLMVEVANTLEFLRDRAFGQSPNGLARNHTECTSVHSQEDHEHFEAWWKSAESWASLDGTGREKHVAKAAFLAAFKLKDGKR